MPSEYKYVYLLGRRILEVLLARESALHQSPRYCSNCGVFNQASNLDPDIEVVPNSISQLKKVALYSPPPRPIWSNVISNRLLDALQRAVPETPLLVGRVFDIGAKQIASVSTALVPESERLGGRAPSSNGGAKCPVCGRSKGDYFYLGRELVSFLSIEDVAERRVLSDSSGGWRLVYRLDAIAHILADPSYEVNGVPVPVWPAETRVDDPWVKEWDHFLREARRAERTTKD